MGQYVIVVRPVAFGFNTLVSGLNCHPQLYRVGGRVNQVLLRAEIPFCRLDRRMSEK